MIKRPVNGEKACERTIPKGPSNCEKPLTSGVTIESEKGGICTAGPLAIPNKEPEKKERTYLLTAGHCIATGGPEPEGNYLYPGYQRGAPERLANPNCLVGGMMEPWKGERWFAFTKAAPLVPVEIGRAGSYVYNDTDDYGEICITNPAWMTGAKKDPLWAVIAEWNSPEERFHVNSLKAPELGEESCHEGQTSGHSCGDITEVPVELPGPPVVVTNFVRVENGEVFSEKGDSGGPWYEHEAGGEGAVEMEGIHSHVIMGKTAVGEARFFEDLTPALNGLGLELLTTANEVR